MSTIRERLSSSEFLARLERVARLFGRVAHDGTSNGRLRVVLVIAMSFLGASAQAGTIAALNFFVKGIESDVPTVAPYFGFPIQNDVRTLVLLTGVVLSLQLVNALAIYYVGVTSRAIGRAFHLRSAAQILEGFLADPLPSPRARECTLGSGRCRLRLPADPGDCIEQMIGTLQAACYVVGFLVVLFKISVEVSLFTLPVFLRRASVSLPPEHADAEGGQIVLRDGEEARSLELHLGISSAASDQTNVHPALYGAIQTQQYRDSEVVRNFLDTFDQMRLSQRRSDPHHLALPRLPALPDPRGVGVLLDSRGLLLGGAVGLRAGALAAREPRPERDGQPGESQSVPAADRGLTTRSGRAGGRGHRPTGCEARRTARDPPAAGASMETRGGWR